MWKNNILETIGNTPMVKLNYFSKLLNTTVVAKVETFNPGNSIKDRMALKMIEDAEAAGILKPGATIIEGTSGNTGMGLAIAAIIKGYKCIFTTTDKQSKEKFDALRALGAEVIVCPTNVEPEDPRSYYSVSSRLEKEIPNAWKPNQYDNLSNSQAHYESTGPEIWEQSEGKITHLVVGVGTGGTICGTGKYLKEQNPNIKCWGIDTYGSVFKKYKETGIFDKNEIYPYITEGIGEDFLPQNVDFNLIDHFEKVTDKDAAIFTRLISLKEGIFVGNSAGAAMAGLVQMKDQLKPDDVVVVIFHDHGTRYLGKMFNDEWMRDRGFLNTDELTVRSLIITGSIQQAKGIKAFENIHEVFTFLSDNDISQAPVYDENGNQVGSITDTHLYAELVKNPELKNKTIDAIMQSPFRYVTQEETVKALSSMITKENSALLVKDAMNQEYIITRQDIINSII